MVPGVYLKRIERDSYGRQEFLRVELTHRGVFVPFECEMSDACLSLKSPHGEVQVTYADEQTLRFSAKGVGLCLVNESGQAGYHTHYGFVHQAQKDLVYSCYSSLITVQMSAITGAVTLDAPWNGQMSPIIGASHVKMYGTLEKGLGEWQLHCHEESCWVEHRDDRSFAELCEKRTSDLEAWYAHVQKGCSEAYTEAARHAAYLLWSGVKSPKGKIERPVTFTGLLGFECMWGWDNLFEGLAIEMFEPPLAWNNMVARFDHQTESGLCPQILSNSRVGLQYPPRPLEAWCFGHLSPSSYTRDQLEAFFPKLEAGTQWWFNNRSRNGLNCHYWHGNDSGADNATCFDATPVVESPDLCTYLILQSEGLASMAVALGDHDKKRYWTERAEALLSSLLERLWREDRFGLRRVDNGDFIPTSSLIAYIPLLLGERLPPEVREVMVKNLKTPGHFLAHGGVSSENQTSPLFRCDGYWRGLVWPSWTYLIVDGLLRCGEDELAKDIAKRYCDNCLEHGFHENYNPLTGERCGRAAVLWGPSVYLLLLKVLA